MPIVFGMSLIALALLLFTFAPVNADFYLRLLPGMLLLGLGAEVTFNPVLIAGMSDITEEEAGIASGVLNTAFTMGGAPGLAVLVSLAAHQWSDYCAWQGSIDSTAWWLPFSIVDRCVICGSCSPDRRYILARVDNQSHKARTNTREEFIIDDGQTTAERPL